MSKKKKVISTRDELKPRFLFWGGLIINSICAFIIRLCHENMFLCLHYNLDRRRTCRRIALNHKLHKDPWDQCNHQQLNHSQVVQLGLLQPERKQKNLTQLFFSQTRTILFFYSRYRCSKHQQPYLMA